MEQPLPKTIDLGYANGWVGRDGKIKLPEIVKICEKKGHVKQRTTVGRCLTEYSCEICGYKYLVDSSG